MRTESVLTGRSWRGGLATILVIAVALAGCGIKETGEAQPSPSPSPVLSPSVQPTVQPTPTVFVPGPLIDPDLDLKDPPVEVPLEIRIPSLNVNAPVLGVGLTSENVMDSPKGPIDDPIWHTAFWYRGGGIPGDIGTATIAGHINEPLGRPEIFFHLEDLEPGDIVIIRDTRADIDIRFIVERTQVYTVQESSQPEVLTEIYGAGPVAGKGPQPAPDGLSHLTLITCAGDIVDGAFDAHTVVFATRSE